MLVRGGALAAWRRSAEKSNSRQVRRSRLQQGAMRGADTACLRQTTRSYKLVGLCVLHWAGAPQSSA